MEDNEMAPATGATPMFMARSAADHLGRSVDAAIIRQRERSGLVLLTAVVGAALALSIVAMLVTYLVSGAA
nr:MAG TPA: hypothetical protein [Caudoviricetes sp.]